MQDSTVESANTEFLKHDFEVRHNPELAELTDRDGIQVVIETIYRETTAE